MKKLMIAVAYKWSPDPRETSVLPDGSIDVSRARATISEDDPVAIAVGRALADATGSELVGLTVGGPEAAVPAATKQVLAHGLDRLVIAAAPELAELDATATALHLARLIGELGAEVVLTGDASADESAGLAPAVLAGVLGWPCLLGVREPVVTEAGRLTLHRDGELLDCPLPAVLSIAPDAAEPRLPGMRDLLAAARKPVAVDREPGPISEPTAVRTGARRPPEPQRRRLVDQGPGAAARLVAVLGEEGVL